LLEERTKHVNGFFPGTRIERVPLRRSTLSEVLQGQTFPRKGFLLTFVEACGVDLKADRQWELAWDRLAPQVQYQDHEMATGNLQREIDELRQQLAEAQHRAEVAQAQADKATAELRALVRDGGNEAPIYTLRDLNQQTARIMAEIEKSGMPTFITSNGRFVAIIMSLASGQVEARTLAEMAREIERRERA